jgi:hypothetical protein
VLSVNACAVVRLACPKSCAASTLGRPRIWRLPVTVSRSVANVGPRAIIDSANASRYDQRTPAEMESGERALARTTDVAA